MRPVFAISLIIIFLLSCDEMAPPLGEDELLMSQNANIQPRLLYGSWQISAMQANIPVDLDGDGSSNTNLLLETDCYDDMRIDFFENNGFFSINAQMDFAAGPGDDEFACLNNREDSGTWEINRDELFLYIVIGNILYTDSKTIKLSGNRFSFEVTKEESEIYVNDPGNTLVSDIQIVELEYSRVE
ncbi:lipocalin family protein [Gramella sp. GC03-9]|uniref:Lipocalin family protein n=1 Tax=Christiangramia oceanisediminis TaxID=2920386 RepID=A0A9X2KVH8_9FLAO|nr:lipocalin family protein [Gramella oceanisediminis]MCP9198720.1 lipocalin family protein [Gramella oceanisediminis]